MAKILVTGGCGYIGSQTIIEMLRTTSFEIVSVDNFSNSSENTIERIKKITGKHFINYNVDLCDIEATRNVFRAEGEIAGVIHFAAYKSVSDSVSHPIKYYKNNMESLLNIIQCSKEFGVKHFIFSSSCSVYGNVAKLPVTEDTPLSAPVSPYAHSKLMAEQMIQFIAPVENINFILLRYFNPVGGDITGMNGEDPVNPPSNLVPVITQTAAGIRAKMFVYGSDYNTRDGSCVRDYIHVSDVAIAHIRALEYLIKNSNKTKCEIFNLGSGNGVSVFEAIKAFEKVTGVLLNYEVAPRRDGDVTEIYSNSIKTETLLNWKPKYNIDDMMSTAWKWQQFISGETQK